MFSVCDSTGFHVTTLPREEKEMDHPVGMWVLDALMANNCVGENAVHTMLQEDYGNQWFKMQRANR